MKILEWLSPETKIGFLVGVAFMAIIGVLNPDIVTQSRPDALQSGPRVVTTNHSGSAAEGKDQSGTTDVTLGESSTAR